MLVLCGHCPLSGTVQVVENWYPGNAKDSKGVLLVVTAGKEGAIVGGDKFLGVSSISSGRGMRLGLLQLTGSTELQGLKAATVGLWCASPQPVLGEASARQAGPAFSRVQAAGQP